MSKSNAYLHTLEMMIDMMLSERRSWKKRTRASAGIASTLREPFSGRQGYLIPEKDPYG